MLSIDKKKLVHDFILIIILIVIAVFVGVALYLQAEDENTKQVIVTCGNEVITSYNLTTDLKEETLLATGNLLVIEDGFAYIKDANCSDKLCVKQGKISHVGESIICLPNRLVVKIVGEEYQDNEAESDSENRLDVVPR